jgi:hypothetical protein
MYACREHQAAFGAYPKEHPNVFIAWSIPPAMARPLKWQELILARKRSKNAMLRTYPRYKAVLDMPLKPWNVSPKARIVSERPYGVELEAHAPPPL